MKLLDTADIYIDKRPGGKWNICINQDLVVAEVREHPRSIISTTRYTVDVNGWQHEFKTIGDVWEWVDEKFRKGFTTKEVPHGTTR